MSVAVCANKKDTPPVKEITRFKFKEPKLRETTLDKSVRCMTLNLKKQLIPQEFLADEVQSIDLCVEKIYEIKRQLKVERQEFFRRPLTQARIKEKRKNDEHYDDFIREYEEQESLLRDFELVLPSSKHANSLKAAAITGAIDSNPAVQATTNGQAGTGNNASQKQEKEKEKQEKKKEKKKMQMFGKLIQKEPAFRLYNVIKCEEDGNKLEVEEEIEAPSFKYKYMTKEQLQQQKLDNQPKKHNIPEKYCKCCNQLVRRHYCPHDFCPKPCLRHEKEKRLRQQYLDKNGGVRKQKKPLYKASILANDISMAQSALDETCTLEERQELERIHQQKIQAHLQMMQENELKIQQFKLQNADSLIPKKKGRKPKAKGNEGNTSSGNAGAQGQQGDKSEGQEDQQQSNGAGEGIEIEKQPSEKTTKPQKAASKANKNESKEEKSSNKVKEIHDQLDQILKRKGSLNDRPDKADKSDPKNDSQTAEKIQEEEQQLLKQLEAHNNVQNILVGGSKIIYRNEDSSYESSSSGISSGSSSEDEGKENKMEEED